MVWSGSCCCVCCVSDGSLGTQNVKGVLRFAAVVRQLYSAATALWPAGVRCAWRCRLLIRHRTPCSCFLTLEPLTLASAALLGAHVRRPEALDLAFWARTLSKDCTDNEPVVLSANPCRNSPQSIRPVDGLLGQPRVLANCYKRKGSKGHTMSGCWQPVAAAQLITPCQYAASRRRSTSNSYAQIKSSEQHTLAQIERLQ